MIFSPILLNAGRRVGGQLDTPIDIALTLSMADLKLSFIDSERGRVDYASARLSEKFKGYEDLARGLLDFDLLSLKERNQRLSFWINIYNIVVIHGVVALGITESVKEFPYFFDRITYIIGGYRFSLNDIEHGILRGNRRAPYRLLKPFWKSDPRLKFTIQPMDPRIHFALVCGARSCPPVSFYDPEQIDFQLELASKSFINSPHVVVIPERKEIRISKIFKWYKKDFGGGRLSVIDTILTYLDEGERKDFLRDYKNQISIRYQSYDWSLNREWEDWS